MMSQFLPKYKTQTHKNILFTKVSCSFFPGNRQQHAGPFGWQCWQAHWHLHQNILCTV